MMVIDTSAVVAILLGEPEAPLFARRIAADPTRLNDQVLGSGPTRKRSCGPARRIWLNRVASADCARVS